MDRSRRNKTSLDYRVLHRTGRKVPKLRSSDQNGDSSEEEMSKTVELDPAHLKSLVHNEEEFFEEITEFLEENKPEDAVNIEDIDENVLEIKELRKVFKRVHREMKTDIAEHERELRPRLDEQLAKISDYLAEAKAEKKTRLNNAEQQKIWEQDEEKRVLHEKEVTEKKLKVEQEKRITNIKNKEINEKITQIEKLCDDVVDGKKGVDKIQDDEVLDLKSNLSNIDKELRDLRDMRDKFENLSTRFEERESIIKELAGKFSKISDIVVKHKERLKAEVQKRELEDYKLKSMEKLNIQLPKFSGTDNKIDIYSFQTKFEEEHARLPKSKCLYQLKEKYLIGAAKEMVRFVEDLNEVWKTLKDAFGDPVVLLNNELDGVKKLGPLPKIKDHQELAVALSKLANAMENLSKIAKTHRIEYELYNSHSECLLYEIIGDQRVDRFLEKMGTGEPLSKVEEWEMLKSFLREESKRRSKMALRLKPISKSTPLRKDTGEKKSFHTDDIEDKLHESSSTYRGNTMNGKCRVCGGYDCENKDDKSLEYVKCVKFRSMTPRERLNRIKKDKVCFQCLQTSHDCKKDCPSDEYSCKNEFHKKFSKSLHVLVCEVHQQENKRLLEEYKLKVFKTKSNIPKNFVAVTPLYTTGKNGFTDREDSAVYMFQRIEVDGKKYNLFFDSGCGDMVCKKDATTRLGKHANQEIAGPKQLCGVGDKVMETKHGIWKIRLPLANGNEAVMSGVCLDKITHKFPEYRFDDAVKKDIFEYCSKHHIDKNSIPKLPEEAGGETDIMIGIQYKKYFPLEILRLPTGLTVFESQFVSIDGTRGIVAGPHPSFTVTEARYGNQFAGKAYHTPSTHEVELGTSLNPDTDVLGFKEDADIFKDLAIGGQSHHERLQKKVMLHETAESVGTVVDYRCVVCRDCETCKHGDRIEAISLQGEYEQHIIDKSVHVDIEQGISIASLPFIERPEKILVSHQEDALRIFKHELKRLEKCPKSKEEVVASEKKLQDLAYVEDVENLTQEQQNMLKGSKIQNVIPWRPVWSKSVTTPCRMCFDASHKSKGRRSLNSVLAKGINSMNKLLEIVLRWCIHKVAYHTDIAKMYNTIRLREEDWCYQLYFWREGLDVRNPVKLKVIKTLIYGVRPSGNQAEKALRLTAEKMKTEFPDAAKVINDDIYVDDCFSGESNWNKAMSITDDLKIVLARGGFALKGFTFSGQDPPEHLSEDKMSIKVAGMNWFPKEDVVKLSTGEMNFERKRRGKRTREKLGVIPERLTRRQCVGKVAEIFDLTGKVTPIVAGMKLDLRVLNQRKLQWDDVIPDDLRQIWADNFEMMQEIAELKFQRTIIPDDAESIDIKTLEFGDSSNSLICAAIYSRVKRVSGSYSCQLVFSRSKFLPEGTTMPRGELAAAHLNTTTGFVVRKSFGKYHKGYTKFTDSQVALYWINSRDKPLKQWARGKVIEINRLSECRCWYFIQSKDNMADIGTRKGVQVKDVDQNSLWRNGFPWMQKDEADFPTMTVDDITMRSIKEDVNEEMLKYGHVLVAIELSCGEEELKMKRDDEHYNLCCYKPCGNIAPGSISERYKFCDYLLDPNKFRLRKVIRIIALVKRFIKNIKTKLCKPVQGSDEECLKKIPNGMNKTEGNAIVLTDREWMSGLEYFYKKSTLEIKKFRKKKDYELISEEVNDILYYKGRILLEQGVTGDKDMCDVILDLSCKTFWVPLVDRMSPFAYSIINEVHWHTREAKHTGVEKTLRYTLQFGHILEGRELVKKIRQSCVRCRMLARKQLKVIMGPMSKHNLNIAPAFYVTQVDLLGPLQSYHGANKRTKMKIWLIVFCCCTTGAVDIKVMEGYTASDFILGFKRFSSRAGYPKILLPDQGSQLLKACGEVTLNFSSIKGKLNTEFGVEFEACPVGAHYMHGKVERRIRQIRESIARSLDGYKLSSLEWETLAADIANGINNLPIGVLNAKVDIGNLDLLTPNRLLLGRNNDRSPVNPVEVSGRFNKIIDANNEIYRIWFKCWMVEYVPLLMQQQKWHESDDRSLEVGDVVMFKKEEKEIECRYQYGIVKELKCSADGIARKAIVEFQNSNENVKRTTTRGVRELILIQHVDEVGVMVEIDQAMRDN